jgi:ABC-type dipeptide/oligopeptide/nickel transport system permease component
MRSTLYGTGLFVARRLGTTIVALIGVTLIVFLLSHEIGDPVYLLLGQHATGAEEAALRHKYGFDRPLLAQYFSYLNDLVHGNLGSSVVNSEAVTTELGQHFPATLELTLAGMLIGIAWTVPLGIIAAIRPGGVVDRVSRYLVRFGVAMPSFWLGMLLVYVFYYILKIAPAPTGELDIGIAVPRDITGMYVADSLLTGDTQAFWSSLRHLILPAVTLAVTSCPPILAVTREAMRRVLDSPYIQTARAAGLSQRSIYGRFALKNATLPISTMIAMTFGYLLGGTVLVETVFSWPGIGEYAVQSMQSLDYEPVLGIVLLAAVIYLVIYFLTDLFALVIDPRARRAQ